MESNPDSQMLAEISGQVAVPADELPVGDVGAVASVEEVAEPVEVDPAAPAPIILDGKEFATESEAYAYSQEQLKESETEKLVLLAKQEAFEQAMQYNQQAAAPAPVVEEIDDSDEFYADPQGYFKKKTVSLKEQIRAEVLNEVKATNEDAKLWGEFFAAHPDLDGFKSDCQQVLDENLKTVQVLAAKDRKKAMDFLATKTRSKFQAYNERLKPRTELHRTAAVPSIGGNPVQGVTPATKDDEPLDLMAQMRTLRK